MTPSYQKLPSQAVAETTDNSSAVIDARQSSQNTETQPETITTKRLIPSPLNGLWALTILI